MWNINTTDKNKTLCSSGIQTVLSWSISYCVNGLDYLLTHSQPQICT